ncbi:MAG TPA: NAD-dependent epimerase/dehydratase family protein, partial [Candidatus Paceibacterota bacterium]
MTHNMEHKKIILVTGGAGFVGSHLVLRLVKEGHHVISLDNYFTGSYDNHVPGALYREGHTKDIEKHVPEKPDLIYHLAEYSRVEKSLEEPAVVWDLNTVGTFGVVEFWRKYGGKLVYAGSSTKFGDGGLGRNQSPYAWTKATNTELVRNYGHWYQLPYAITYFYNVYGPGERAGAY